MQPTLKQQREIADAAFQEYKDSKPGLNVGTDNDPIKAND
jgi:hypothetical protein